MCKIITKAILHDHGTILNSKSNYNVLELYFIWLIGLLNDDLINI